MLKRVGFLFLLVTSSVWALSVLNISRFNFVNSLFLDRNTLVAGTDGGVLLINTFPKEIKASYVTEYPVNLALIDPLTQEIFFVTHGELHRWNPYMTWSTDLGYVGEVSSMGIDANHLYLEKNGTVSKYTKTGAYLGKVSHFLNVKWTGKRGEISHNDPFLVHLSPFFIQSPTMGKIEFNSIIRDLDRTRIWVGTDGGGIFLYSAHTWQPIDSVSFGVLPRPVYSLWGKDDSLWIGGKGGLTLKTRENWVSFSREGIFDLSCDEIRDLTGDGGVLWALTDCGLLRNERSFRLYRVSNITHIESIEASSPYLWVGGDRGIGWMPLTGGSIDWVKNSSNLQVEDIVAAPRNIYILSIAGVLIYNKASRQWKSLEDPKGWSQFLAEKGTARGDTVIFATERGIIELIDGVEGYEYISPPFSPDKVFVNDVSLSDYGLFVATNSGLYVRERKTGTWRRYGVHDGLADDKINALWAKGDTVYVGTERGVTILVP